LVRDGDGGSGEGALRDGFAKDGEGGGEQFVLIVKGCGEHGGGEIHAV